MLIVVHRERLGFQRCHVDAERALALARLALEAQVEDAVQPVAAKRRARVRQGQRVEQGVRAAPGRVFFVARGHVRRAHDAGRGLAAQPDVHAAVGGAAHSAGSLETEPGRKLRPFRPRHIAQVACHGRRVHDLPRVHPVLRIEQPLGLLHGRVQVVTEDTAVEFAAGEPVAVLARVHPAVLKNEVAHLFRHRAHQLRLPGFAEVNERADMQAPD